MSSSVLPAVSTATITLPFLRNVCIISAARQYMWSLSPGFAVLYTNLSLKEPVNYTEFETEAWVSGNKNRELGEDLTITAGDWHSLGLKAGTLLFQAKPQSYSSQCGTN